MFNHEEMRKLISAYLDSAVTEQERLDVEKHLCECAECKKYYFEIEKLRAVMGEYGEEELSPDSEQKIKNDFLGGKLKREAVMKKKILISVGSVALTIVLIFVFAVQPIMKRGIQGSMKESTEKIFGGTNYSVSDSASYSSGNVLAGSASGLEKGVFVANKFHGAAIGGATNRYGANRDVEAGLAHWGVSSNFNKGASLDPSAGSFNYESYDSPLALTGSAASQSVAMAPSSMQAYPEYSDVPVVIIEPYLPQSGNGEKVIYSAAVYIKVKDAQAVYDRASQITRENKGFLGSTNFAQTSDGKVLATMILRVPREKFEAVLNALRTLGDVKGINSSNVDVSLRYQELNQQLNNVKVIYDKMVDSLKDKKTDIEKAQRMESALTPYLKRIEMLRRQLEIYDNKIAMSTITVTFEESSLRTFLKHDFENIHEQAIRRVVAALKSLVLMVPAFIAFAVSLLCAFAAWNALRNNFLKK